VILQEARCTISPRVIAISMLLLQSSCYKHMLNAHIFALKAVTVVYRRLELLVFQSLVRLSPALTSLNATSRTHACVLCAFLWLPLRKSRTHALREEFLAVIFLLSLIFQIFYYIFFYSINIFSINFNYVFIISICQLFNYPIDLIILEKSIY